jgi:hypothetical protein
VIRGPYRLGHRARRLQRLLESRDVAVGAVGRKAEPERQPARAPGQVDGEVRRVPGLAVNLVQLARSLRVRGARRLGIAVEKRATVEGSEQPLGRGRDGGDRVRPLGESAPSTIMVLVLVLLYLDRGGHLADTACWRRCHASIKSRQTSPTGDERHNRTEVRPTRPTASKRVSSPPVGTIPSASDVTDEPKSQQQASKEQRRVRIDRLRAALPRFVQRWHEPGSPPLSNHSPPTLTKAPVQISGSRGCRRRARCSGRDRGRWPSDTGCQHRAAPVRRWRRQWPSCRACRLARRRRKPRANQPTGA